MSTTVTSEGLRQEPSKELGTSNVDIGSDTSSDEKDVAAELVGERAQSVDLWVERRAIRKIDWFLIPAMVVGYGLVYYDKVSNDPMVGQSFD